MAPRIEAQVVQVYANQSLMAGPTKETLSVASDYLSLDSQREEWAGAVYEARTHGSVRGMR